MGGTGRGFRVNPGSGWLVRCGHARYAPSRAARSLPEHGRGAAGTRPGLAGLLASLGGEPGPAVPAHLAAPAPDKAGPPRVDGKARGGRSCIRRSSLAVRAACVNGIMPRLPAGLGRHHALAASTAAAHLGATWRKRPEGTALASARRGLSAWRARSAKPNPLPPRPGLCHHPQPHHATGEPTCRTAPRPSPRPSSSPRAT